MGMEDGANSAEPQTYSRPRSGRRLKAVIAALVAVMILVAFFAIQYRLQPDSYASDIGVFTEFARRWNYKDFKGALELTVLRFNSSQLGTCVQEQERKLETDGSFSYNLSSIIEVVMDYALNQDAIMIRNTVVDDYGVRISNYSVVSIQRSFDGEEPYDILFCCVEVSGSWFVACPLYLHFPIQFSF